VVQIDLQAVAVATEIDDRLAAVRRVHRSHPLGGIGAGRLARHLL
jgi:hypothetical protein